MIVGKAPQPGRSKTRLVPPLTDTEAADLSAAFLLDTCATALSLGWARVSLVYPPAANALGILEALLPPGIVPVRQDGDGLGQALASAFARHFEAAYQQVVLIGSDTPDIRSAVLLAAAHVLEDQADVAIGPAIDGGYYLLGLREPWPALFEDITWSTNQVHSQTLLRAHALGLRVTQLPVWGDVDTPLDLARLQADLERAPATVAAHTRQALARIDLDLTERAGLASIPRRRRSARPGAHPVREPGHDASAR